MHYYTENELLDLEIKYKDNHEVLTLISVVKELQPKKLRDDETGELVAE